jgi:hypothetical protein
MDQSKRTGVECKDVVHLRAAMGLSGRRASTDHKMIRYQTRRLAESAMREAAARPALRNGATIDNHDGSRLQVSGVMSLVGARILIAQLRGDKHLTHVGDISGARAARGAVAISTAVQA